MYRILNAEPAHYSEEALAIVSRVATVVESQFSRQELIQNISNFDVLITRLGHKIDDEVLSAASNLKAVACATTGLDHIDRESAEKRGISVLSLQGETEFLRTISATAELTWGLLISLVRNIPAAHSSVCSNSWDRDDFWGTQLRGRTLGIVGLGRLGAIVARYGQAFGMRVCAFDPFVTTASPRVELMSGLSELLEQTFVLSLHVPLLESTIGLIGRQEIARLPHGAVVINTSRGQVVDENAMLESLKSGHLGGAALDVIADEQSCDITSSDALRDFARNHNNLILTPHIGGATHDSIAATEIFIAQKICDFLKHHNAEAP